MRNRNFDGGQPFRNYIIRYIEKILDAGRRMHDLLWDIRLGINTREIVSRTDCTSQNKDARKCCPSPYFRLHQIFNRISINEGDIFADYGCGVGRVVCFAARLPFAKVYGVELYPDIALVARRNAQKVRNRQATVEIIEGDVLDFNCQDVTIFFFYDPFEDQTIQNVLERIHSTLLKNPCHTQIVYYGESERRSLFDNMSWLEEKEGLRIRKMVRARDIVRFYQSTI